jgi:hypothetical protein
MAYVSDHAVLRFLERQHGVDVEGIRAALTVKAIDKAAAFGCGTIKLGNGARLKLNGDVASTCLGKRKARKHPHGH